MAQGWGPWLGSSPLQAGYPVTGLFERRPWEKAGRPQPQAGWTAAHVGTSSLWEPAAEVP